MLAVVALFLFISPFFSSFAGGGGLDSAWIIGLNQGFADGLVFGRDLVFTFGPYASVYSREYNPGSNTIALFGSICLATAFVVQFLRWALVEERRMLPVWVAMVGIALFNQKDSLVGLIHFDQMLEVTERCLRQKLRKDSLAPAHKPASSFLRGNDDTALGQNLKSNSRNRKSPAISCLT